MGKRAEHLFVSKCRLVRWYISKGIGKQRREGAVERAEGRRVRAGDYWRILEYIGLPKTEKAEEWASFRWIGKAPSLQKVYTCAC